ncbi:BTB/POZ protein [Cladorrhinum sp. PSN259]|nr:BTB/POZ protein [Cladorrhinum sp. PSN259]
MASVTSNSTIQLDESSKDGQSNMCSTDEVVLNVGGQEFITTIGTLVDRSDFFAALLSGRWNVSTNANGSIFIDADPAIFAHIIRYLRRGVFPLVFDEKTGDHNIGLYINLLPEAKYYQIRMLEAWLRDELYLKCVEHTSVWKYIWESPAQSWSSNASAQLVKVKTTTTHSWACPCMLRLEAHEGTRYRHRCEHAPEKHGAIDSDESTQWAEYSKKLTFHKGWCSDEGDEFQDYWKKKQEELRSRD